MEKKYKIGGMSCAACASHVDKAIRKLDSVVDCNVNLLTNSATVKFKDSPNDLELKKAVRQAGYDVILEENLKEKNKDYNLRNLIISFILLFILMYISMGHMIHLPLPKFFDNGIIYSVSQLLLTIPIYIIYRKYFVSGYKKLFKLAPNMDSLVALSATFSMVYGIYAIVNIIIGMKTNNMELMNHYHHNLYFESGAMILTLVSFGKFLESLSKKRTLDAITSLVNLVPDTILIKKDGKEELVKVSDAHIGDIAIFRQGDILACDGIISSGSGSLNEANITGESMPRYKEIGDNVYSSSVLNNGFIEVKITKELEDNSISQIINLVSEASNSKAPISRFADKVSLIFVPAVMAISLLSFILFLIFAQSFELAFNMFCSVLVVACPCALGLATPVAIMVGIGKGAKNNLLIKNATILEKANQIDCVVLDKTGTITKGYPEVLKEYKFDDRACDIAYSLEHMSNHPLSNAITNYLSNAKCLEVSDFKVADGLGIVGKVNKKEYMIGNLKFARKFVHFTSEHNKIFEEGYHLGATILILFDCREVLAIYLIKDQIRDNSKKAISLLNKIGIDTILLTGDNEEAAYNVAISVGIDKVYHDVLPSQKSEVVKELQQSHRCVAMIGDGVNDSVALTVADIGIAIGSGSDIATKCSDIILQRNDLLDVYNVIELSKKTVRTIKFNLFWAFFYNLIGIVFASGLLYPINHSLVLQPMICSLLMSFSSVFVVINALTINLFKPVREDLKVEEVKMEELKIEVKGMMCKMCVKHVEEACKSQKGVVDACASLEENNVKVTGNGLDLDSLKQAIRSAGYEA